MLSTYNTVGVVSETPISRSRPRWYTISVAAFDAAITSASVEDREMHSWRLLA